MNRLPFVTNEYYHIYNRGVDKRQVFMNDADRYRFLHDLWEFNDEENVAPFIRRTSKNPIKTTGDSISPKTVGDTISNSKEPLVEICCFCLMPNHYHLLLKQLQDDGLSLFMRKLGIGYTYYFDEKYERSGTLFQGKFKAKHIDNDAYLTHLTKYIHLNPVDLCEPEWGEKGIQNPEMIKDFLKNYKWSSFKDYIGEKNYPSLIKNNLIMDMLGGELGYKKFALGDLSGDFSASAKGTDASSGAKGGSAFGGENINNYLLD